MLTPEDKSVVTSLLRRYIAVWDRNARHNQWKVELERLIAVDLQEFSKLHVAFSLYGFDTASPEGFQRLQAEFGAEEYTKLLNDARQINATKVNDQQGAAPTSEDSSSSVRADKIAPPESPGNVREVVLGYLRHAFPEGAKASEIRKFVENVRKAPLHEKTIGMTLYRLSKDGIVERKGGRTWFYVPSQTEAENPGGATPGLINSPN